MRFHSILFASPDLSTQPQSRNAPEFFHDLNLDRVVEAIGADWQDSDLAPWFYTPLSDLDAIAYRQEVMQDIEDEAVMRVVRSFLERMRAAHRNLDLVGELYNTRHKQGWLLAAVRLYCDAVEHLSRDLCPVHLASRGMCAFRDFITEYVASDDFSKLVADTDRVDRGLSAISYCLLIKDSSITVCRYHNQIDYSTAVEMTFEKFRAGAAKDYRVKFPNRTGMNHVEAQILDRVALLHPEPFRVLDEFCAEHTDHLDHRITAFDREIRFYIAYLEYAGKLRRSGLTFCYPQISDKSKEVSGHDTFDLALAARLTEEGAIVVCNDFYLCEPERILVVSGPNQGGKTTFARMFGQLHFLARLGCPVPGTRARLLLFDHLFSHFEREEDITTLRSKLEDDLVRIRRILDQASPNSIVIINEIFSSTTLNDALSLSRKVLTQIAGLDLLCVCVTFLDELSSLNDKTVSMVSTVKPDNPAVRTFKVERQPADGLAYALAIAEKHHVTYDWLKKRIKG